jgi:hypothetical protein
MQYRLEQKKQMPDLLLQSMHVGRLVRPTKGISNRLYVNLVGKMSMSSTNKLSYNYSNRLYLCYPIDDEKINVIVLHFTLKLVQRLLVILHTTLLSLHIYYMPHHHYVLGGKFTNTYLTAVGDALRASTIVGL